MQDEIKRWEAKHKIGLILTSSNARPPWLRPDEPMTYLFLMEEWVEYGKWEKRMLCGPSLLKSRNSSNGSSPSCWRRRSGGAETACQQNELAAAKRVRFMNLDLQQAFKDDVVMVSLIKLWRWFGVTRRRAYFKLIKGEPKVLEKFIKPVKAMIEVSQSFGYRTVAHLLDMKKNPANRVPDHGQASAQTACSVSPEDSGLALGGCCAE